VIKYEKYLDLIVDLTRLAKHPEQSRDYPENMNTGAKRALYDNLDHDAGLAEALDKAIRNTKKDGWRGNTMKEREVRNVIRKFINDKQEEYIFKLVKNQNEY
jgi:type I restriction enzyme R subunit